MQKTTLECSTVRDDNGIPVFLIKEDLIPVLVLDYYTVKKLLEYISQYLLIAERYYEDD